MTDIADLNKMFLPDGTRMSMFQWSGTGDGGTTDHSLLTNLSYATAGHTGFAANPAAATQDMNSYPMTGVPSIRSPDGLVLDIKYYSAPTEYTRFRIGTDITTYSNLKPSATATYDLGTSSNAWKYVYTGKIGNGGADVYFGDDINMTKAANVYGDIKSVGNLTPGITDTKDFGNSTYWWRYGYAQRYYVDDANTYSMTDTSGNLELHVATGKKVEIVVG